MVFYIRFAWTRVGVVQLFIEHICLPEGGDAGLSVKRCMPLWTVGSILDYDAKLLLPYCIVLCYIVYRYLYSASHGVSQTEALSVHFSSRKKVRRKARERDEERGAERINERKG